jgi:membrane-bound lytic murein transglycosylase B
MKKFIFYLFLILSSQIFADVKDNYLIKASSIQKVNDFIFDMANKHKFKESELSFLFDNIILKIKKPDSKVAEKKIKKKQPKITWDKFSKIFLTKQRIEGGAEFLKTHYKTLQKAEDIFGVQKEIIVAILGVETNYGQDTGKYPTMKTLTALAFGKNRRQKFYKKELEEFLIMARKNSIAPLSIYGSHAGAMGFAQFISSSYNYYAIDFNGDGKVNLFNTEDAIGSIANYLKKHYWQTDGEFAKQVSDRYQKLAKFATNKPKIKNKKWQLTNIANDKKLAFIKLQNKDKIETWVTFWNFYVITRYNHDNKYAMVVVNLAKKITNKLKKL